MGGDALRQRTKAYALRVIKPVDALPNNPTTNVIGKQLLRCATSVGANYRAASRAKSPADFIAKMGIVEEEADECLYWLELLLRTRLVAPERTAPLQTEGRELLAMTVASIKTARLRKP